MKFLEGLCDFYWLLFSLGLSPTEIHGGFFNIFVFFFLNFKVGVLVFIVKRT